MCLSRVLSDEASWADESKGSLAGERQRLGAFLSLTLFVFEETLEIEMQTWPRLQRLSSSFWAGGLRGGIWDGDVSLHFSQLISYRLPGDEISGYLETPSETPSTETRAAASQAHMGEGWVC